MVLSSWQSHCESSPGSFDERRMAPSVRRPKLLAFWLETVYSRPFLGSFFGNIFPIWRHPSSWPPKGPSLGGNTSFEPSSVRISATVRPGRMIEKNSITKNSEKCYISPIWGNPRWANSTIKLHGGWCPWRNHVCRVSNWNLHGLRFYRGSNFRFSHWFLHGPYNSAALMRCLWFLLVNVITFLVTVKVTVISDILVTITVTVNLLLFFI